MRSGLFPNRTYGKPNWKRKWNGVDDDNSSGRNSIDRPESIFGVPSLDDGSVRQLLHLVTPAQHRNVVVMEARGNLLQTERREMLRRIKAPHLNLVALVLMGSPVSDVDVMARRNRLKLKEKQAALDADCVTKKEDWLRRKQQKERERSVRDATRQAEKTIRQAAVEERRRVYEEKKAAGEVVEEPKEEPEPAEKTEEEDVEPSIQDDMDDIRPANLSSALVQSMIGRASQKMQVLDEMFLSKQKQDFHGQDNSEAYDEAKELIEIAKDDLAKASSPDEDSDKQLFNAYKEAETAFKDAERLSASMNVAIVVL